MIFGTAFKFLGPIGILFLTPALASLSVFIIYRLFYRIFNDLDVSLVIALLLLPLAPWLFFANVVMLPTILFIFLLASGLLALFKSWQEKRMFGLLLVFFGGSHHRH